MASSGQIKGITIKIEGDTSGLAKSLTSVNGEIKKTEGALKDVDKALKLDPTNIDLVAQKQELLEKQIGQTAEKLELEKQAAEEAKEALALGKISTEEYATLTAEVSNTQQELNSLTQSADENEEALGKLSINASAAGKAFNVFKEGVELAVKGAWEVTKTYTELCLKALAELGNAAIEGGKALVDASIDTAAFADEMITMSTVTGLSTDKLQELSYSAGLIDVDVDTLTGSMTRNIKAMSSAADAANALAEEQEEAAEAFARHEISAEEYNEVMAKTASAYDTLGISVTNADGSLRDSEDVYWEVIDALGNVDNETERNAIAMELLGKSAMDLNPIIEAGGERMNELAEEAHNVGAVMDSETIDAFGALDDNMQRLNQGSQAAKRALGTVLLPSLTDMSGRGVDLLNQFTNALLDTDGDISKFGDVIAEIIPQAVDFILEYLPQFIDTAVQIIIAICDGLTRPESMESLKTGITEIVGTLSDAIITLAPVLIPAVFEIIATIVETLIQPENIQKVIQSAIEIVKSIASGISQNVAELIPAVFDCIIAITGALLDPKNILALIEAAWDVVKAIGTGIGEALGFNTFKNAVEDIFNKIAENIGKAINSAWQWGYDMIQNFANGIIAASDLCTDGIEFYADLIDDYLGHSTPDKGPLKDDDKWGADFVDNWVEGMESKQPELQAAIEAQANMLAIGTNPDYSGSLNSISGTLASIASSKNGMYVINVQLGTTSLGSVVLNEQQIENFRSGGV